MDWYRLTWLFQLFQLPFAALSPQVILDDGGLMSEARRIEDLQRLEVRSLQPLHYGYITVTLSFQYCYLVHL